MRTTGQHPGDRPSPGFPLSTHELCHVTAQSRHSPGTGGAGGACVVAELHLPATIARKLRKRARLAAVEGDVRPDYRLVENPPARTAARRTLPLMGEPLELLRDYIASEKLRDADYFFRHLDRRLRRAWEQIRTEIGIDDVWWHDLRHTYAVYCARAGMPLPTLKVRLGHATIRMTMRYTQYTPGQSTTHDYSAMTDMGLQRQETLSLTPTECRSAWFGSTRVAFRISRAVIRG
jgi:hypothetical protein